MQINEALNALGDGHTIWKVGFAKRVCKALSIPFDTKLIQKFYSEPDIMGAHMTEGNEGSLGVYGLTLSGYVAKVLGVEDTTRKTIGRGTQARLYAESVRNHINKLASKGLRVHDTIMIYEDPITEQKPEGKACLLHKIEDLSDGLERWKVCFEGEDGGVYERTIKGK